MIAVRRLPITVLLYYAVSLSTTAVCGVSALVPPAPTIAKQAVVATTPASTVSTISRRWPSGQLAGDRIIVDDDRTSASFLSVFLSVATERDAERDAVSAATETQRPSSWESALGSIRLVDDEVVRVLDPNTVKLKRGGLVSFGAVRTPSGYGGGSPQFPDCLNRSPADRAKELLPPGTRVGVYFADGSVVSGGGKDGRPRAALIVARKTGKLVNAELVRSGFARPAAVPGGAPGVYEGVLPGFTAGLRALREDAEREGSGIYRRCGGDAAANANANAIAADRPPPRNPGDVRSCSDFPSYEDALRYYETYYPYYGDVARLDRDGDGIPCEGLPHTRAAELYRVKKPR